MSHFTHTVRVYLRRFWREMVIFWAVSGTASVMALRGAGNYPDAGLSMLEGLVLLIVVVRLMQAENVFRTLGGWQVRPVHGRTLRNARWVLLMMNLAPAVAGRMAVTALTFSPGGKEWLVLMLAVWLPLLLGIAVGALGAGLLGRDARSGEAYRYPALAGGVVVCALGLAAGFAAARQSPARQSWGSGGGGTGLLLSEAGGDLSNGRPKPVAGMKELMRLPMRAGASAEFGGCRAVLSECAVSGTRVMATLEITAPCAALRPWALSSVRDKDHVILVRYSDGNWARSSYTSHDTDATVLAGLTAEKFIFGCSFTSPLILPENNRTPEQLLAEAELFFFVPAERGGYGPGPQDWSVASRVPKAAEAEPKPAPAPALSELLARLKIDPQAGEEMVKRGWTAEAMPLLREHLLNGLPLKEKSLAAVIALKDPSLAGALQKAMLTTRIYDPKVLALVRDHPGIDWSALAAAAWHRNNFRIRTGADFGWKNPWTGLAVTTGHGPALRELAAQWCLNPPASAEIHGVIAASAWNGEVKDFPAWLRANVDRLQWHAAGSRWVLPEQP